jgi:DAACS family dicarboxylate/amino acid:cation (Na+ or H+) symporter
MSEQKRKMGLPAKMGIGLVAGVIVGLIWQSAGGLDSSWFKPFGDLFIRLIRMIVVPLVFASLVAGAAGMGNAAKLGRIAVKTLIYYLATTAVAVGLGLLFANLIDPGVGLTMSTEGLKAKEVTPPSFWTTILNIVPMNPAQALAEGKLLQILFFAIVFGFALSAIGEKGKGLVSLFDQLFHVMLKLTGMVMSLAPYGVFALIAYTVGNYGLSVLLPLGKLIVTMYIVSVIHVFLVYVLLVKGFVGLNIKDFFRAMSEPLLLAFTTCSSAAALPANMRAARRMGASQNVTSFSIPLGTTINMDGAAIYLGIALVAGVDRVLDMARTSLNVLGDATGAMVVSKAEGEFGTDELDEELKAEPTVA